MNNSAVMSMEDALATGVGPLTRRMIEFELLARSITRAGQLRTVTEQDWAPLAAMVATEGFERVGVWGDRRNWSDYLTVLIEFANDSTFETKLRRITEVPGRVIAEVQILMRRHGDPSPSVHNLIEIYEFDEAGLIQRMDTYRQGSD